MKYKKSIIVLALLLMISIISGVSYALWVYTNVQEEQNEISSSCFELTFNGGEVIDLTDAIPLSDEDGSALNPYTFTVKNICSTPTYYYINIETSSTSDMDSSYIKVKLDDEKPVKLGDIALNDNKVIPESIDSRKIGYGQLFKNDEVSYDLRLYLDEDAPYNESESKKYRAKIALSYYQIDGNHSITINPNGGSVKQSKILTRVGNEIGILPSAKKNGYEFAGWYSDEGLTNRINSKTIVTSEMTNIYAKYYEYNNDNTSVFTDGNTLNKMMKTLAGSSNVNDYYTENNNIYYIKRSFDLINSDNIVSSTDSQLPIYMWYEDNTIYYYTDAKKVYLNEDSTGIFAFLKGLKEIDLSEFDFSSATTIEDAFMRDGALTKLDLNSVDTSNVTNMSGTFAGLALTNLDVSHLNTSNVTTMLSMFADSQNIESLDVSMFDTSKVTDMSLMFNHMASLTKLNVSGLNTSNVTDMGGLFSDLYNIETIDISTWNTYSLVNTSFEYDNDEIGMFGSCPKLKTIYVGDHWNTYRLKNDTNMFKDDYKLVGEKGTTYNYSKVGKTYAHVDEGTDNPGYFTYRKN